MLSLGQNPGPEMRDASGRICFESADVGDIGSRTASAFVAVESLHLPCHCMACLQTLARLTPVCERAIRFLPSCMHMHDTPHYRYNINPLLTT